MKCTYVNAYFTNYLGSKLFLLFILILIIPFSVLAQNDNKTDSIISTLSLVEENYRFEILDSLYDQAIQPNPKESFKYAFEMYRLSMSNGNLNQQELACLNIANANYIMSDFDSSYYYTQTAMELNKKTNNSINLATAYSILSDLSYYRGKHEKGIEYCLKAIDLYQKNNDSIEAARLFKEISILNREKGDYDKAMEYAIKSMKFFEKQNDSLYIADSYRIIASIHNSLKNREKQKYNLDKARLYIKNKQETDLYRIVLHDIANFLTQEREYEEALKINYELLNISIEKKELLKAANLYLSIGNTLMKMDSTESALSFFRKAKSLYSDLNLDKYVCHMDYIFGDVYYAIYNYDSAKFYLHKSYIFSKQINYSQIINASLHKLSLTYEETHDYKNAFKYYKEYKQYKDSIIGEEVQFKIAELETKYETSKKEQEILELKYNKKIQESWTLTLKLIIFGVIIIFMLIIIAIWQKRNKDKLIQRQKDLVYKKQRLLTKSELEKSKLKEEELQQSILYKSKQLSTHALHMMQKNTMLQEMQSDLKLLSKKASIDDKQDFKRINLQINQSLRSHKDWDVFKLYFEDVNRNFYQRLNEINTELTTNDHRLCALIKLNMTSKEMASVLNVAPNSIKSSRYRLKKKLGLDVEADLEEFIKGLS